MSTIRGNNPSLKLHRRNKAVPLENKEALKALEHLDQFGPKGSQEPGVYKPFLGFLWNTKQNPEQALERLNAGKSVKVVGSNGESLTMESLEDLKVVDSFLGRQKNSLLPEEQFQAFRAIEQGMDENDGFLIAAKPTDAYHAYNRLAEGRRVRVNLGEQDWLLAESFEDLAEINALVGNGGNGNLPSEQCEALKSLHQGFQGGSYGALQSLQAGQPVTFEMRGGDASGVLRVEVTSLEQLSDVQRRAQNQEEYDRYAQPFSSFKTAAQTVVKQLSETLPGSLDESQGEFEEAQGNLKKAYRTPKKIEDSYSDRDYAFHFGYNSDSGKFENHYGLTDVNKTRKVRNKERGKKIREAGKRTRRAEALLKSSQAIRKALPEIRSGVDSLREDGLSKGVEDLENILGELKDGPQDSKVVQLVRRLEGLLASTKRPARPTGWVPPGPRIGD